MQPKLDELYKHGMEAFEEGDYQKAEGCFAEFLRFNPSFADILI
jgi:TolA-binding protein